MSERLGTPEGEGLGSQHELSVDTRGRGLHDITRPLAEQVARAGVSAGLCHVFIRHTSASLLITENADPDVHRDLETFLADLVPDGDPRFVHRSEGPDDMPAHVRAALTQTHLAIPVVDGRLALGTWQGVYVWEHRRRGHRRRVVVTVR
ncbi:MAG: YjbQ family protein [Gammaproteobacteria bacterium]|nr:YjbQ family protein [Gammaproteobacteria bacterium]